jgi:hypothetical protein
MWIAKEHGSKPPVSSSSVPKESKSSHTLKWITPINQMHFSLSPHQALDQQKILARLQAPAHLKMIQWQLNQNPINSLKRTINHRPFELWISPPDGEHQLCAWASSFSRRCVAFKVTYPTHLKHTILP